MSRKNLGPSNHERMAAMILLVWSITCFLFGMVYGMMQGWVMGS